MAHLGLSPWHPQASSVWNMRRAVSGFPGGLQTRMEASDRTPGRQMWRVSPSLLPVKVAFPMVQRELNNVARAPAPLSYLPLVPWDEMGELAFG